MGKFAYVVEELNKMTSEEFRESLIDAGIIDKDGKLTEKYGGPKKNGKRKE